MGIAIPLITRRKLIGGRIANLPQNTVGVSTLYEDFENVSQWAGTGTAENNTSEKVTGSQSIKITTASGTLATRTKTATYNFAADEVDMWISIYPHSDPGVTLNEVDLFFYQGANAYNRTLKDPNNFTWVPSQWNTCYCGRELWAPANSPDWSLPFTSMQVRVYPKAAQVAIVSFDAFYKAPVTPGVMILFDDGHAGMWPGYQYMQKRHVRGTMYAVTSWANTAGFLTVGQYHKLNSSGWDVANHTDDHTTLTTLNEATQEARLLAGKNAINSWGLSRASSHVAYPSGGHNADTATAMTNTGMITGRLVNNSNFFMPLVTDWKLLPAYYVTNVTTLATVKGLIDTAISTRRIIPLLFHRLNTTTALENEWTYADFYALIDYIVQTGIAPVTITEVNSLRTSSAAVRVP